MCHNDIKGGAICNVMIKIGACELLNQRRKYQLLVCEVPFDVYL
jgi:hypothetical protein